MTDATSARPSPSLQFLVLAGLIVLCLAVGALGAWATASSVSTWYQTIAKPSFTPPDRVFGPVWTALYVMMAVAAWLVWRTGGLDRALRAMVLFAVQLALNLSWSFLFFKARWIGGALVEIALLWFAIAATIAVFRRHSQWAGILMMPYLAWVTFASALNFAIWRLN
jgi:tryptophan-rich sensory protein